MTDKTEVRSILTDFYLEDARGETFPLKLISTVGRDSGCDLVITEGFVSRQHARILIKGDEVWLEDLGSTNGTCINRHRITEPVRVDENDEITFDTAVYVLRKPVAEPDSNACTVVNDSERDVKDDDSTELAGSEKPSVIPEAKPLQPEVEASEPIKGRGEGEAKKVPPSWLENKESPNKTRLLSGTEIQEKLAKAARAKATLDGVPGNDSDYFRLVCASGGAIGQVFSLQAQDTSESKWIVGRDDGIDITIDDTSISAQHFQVIHNSGRWKVVNLMASNGTFVNGERRLSCYLSDGDRIGAGDMEFIFQGPAHVKFNTERAATTVSETPSNRHWPLLVGVGVAIALALALVLVLLFVLG